MRIPERLNNFYKEICKIHKRTFPDLRVGQLWIVFLNWVGQNKKVDPFFPEEDVLLEYFKDFEKYETKYHNREEEKSENKNS